MLALVRPVQLKAAIQDYFLRTRKTTDPENMNKQVIRD
jgi:hypothetical protein